MRLPRKLKKKAKKLKAAHDAMVMTYILDRIEKAIETKIHIIKGLGTKLELP